MARRVALTLAAIAVLIGTAAAQKLPGSTALKNADRSVKFAVLGDSGTGGSAQYAIAKLMADARTRFPFELVIMLGDNMYGSERPRDFQTKFEIPYRPLLSAGVRFYASLGNHDDPRQSFYEPFNMNGNRFYAFRRGDVEFFALDSTYMKQEQVNWITRSLERSDAGWKIAFFHHPIYSSGKRHGSDKQLRGVLEPLFVQYGVDVVFAGHEHFYERLKPQLGVSYFTAGGSAKLRKNNIDPKSPLTDRGFDTDNTFMLAEIAGDQMYFETISRGREVVDAGAITRREAAAKSQ